MAGRTTAKEEWGFTIVELIVTIAIAVVLLALSVPAVTVWLPNYYLRNAAMDIFSNLQFAKTEAIRANSSYAVVFDPGNGRYSLVSSPGADNIFGQGGDDLVENTVRVFDYSPNIAYGHTPATKNFEDGSGTFPGDDVSYTAGTGYADNVVVFDGRGMCNAGSIYLQNNKNRTYAVGTLMSGVLRIARWGGGDWQ